MFNMKDSRLNFCKVDSNPSVEHFPCLITESVPAMQYIVRPADHGNPVAANLQMAALLVTGAVLVIAAGGVVAGHCSRMGVKEAH